MSWRRVAPVTSRPPELTVSLLFKVVAPVTSRPPELTVSLLFKVVAPVTSRPSELTVSFPPDVVVPVVVIVPDIVESTALNVVITVFSSVPSPSLINITLLGKPSLTEASTDAFIYVVEFISLSSELYSPPSVSSLPVIIQPDSSPYPSKTVMSLNVIPPLTTKEWRVVKLLRTDSVEFKTVAPVTVKVLSMAVALPSLNVVAPVTVNDPVSVVTSPVTDNP